jgi:hypothetical protein
MNEALGMGADQYYNEDYFGGGGGPARKREMEAKHRMVSAKIKVLSQGVYASSWSEYTFWKIF